MTWRWSWSKLTDGFCPVLLVTKLKTVLTALSLLPDAFFPLLDNVGIETKEAGIKLPSSLEGSVRDQESIEAADKYEFLDYDLH